MQLHTETLESLRAKYEELSLEYGHVGMDDMDREGGLEFIEKRCQEAAQLLERPYAPTLQGFMRFGVPPSMRRDLYTRCLVPEPMEHSEKWFQDVAKGVYDWEWLTDDVLRLDVAEYAANDSSYFPFDEIIENMVLALSRDPRVFASCECPPQIPIVPAGTEGSSVRSTSLKTTLHSAMYDVEQGVSDSPQFVPPSGIVPFRGFSLYAAPFAFLSDKLEVAYPLFQGFYCAYLSKLHTLSSHSNTLLPLCALFESLVFTSAPHVAFHLINLGPEVSPLKIAFPWIVRGFAGCIPGEQTLLLWDRVIGFGSTELIAVLAAAVFTFRSRMILSATKAEDLELIFSDLSMLKVVPLLQHFLFSEDLGGRFDI